MKKLFALAGAVAIIGVAFIGRGLLFDDDSGGLSIGNGAARVLCPEEFMEICERVEGNLDLHFERAGETADQLIEATSAEELDGHAWVVPKAWADMVIATRAFNNEPPLFEASEPLATTSVVVPIWNGVTDALGCGHNTWACLANGVGKPIPQSDNRLQVGMPDIHSASGLPLAAAQAVGVLGAADFNPAMLHQARVLGDTRTADPFATMRLQGPGRLTAVTVLEAGAQRLNSSLGTIVLADTQPSPRVDLVVLSPAGETIDGDVLNGIRRAFTDAGWRQPSDGPDGLPAGDLLAVIRDEWSK